MYKENKWVSKERLKETISKNVLIKYHKKISASQKD